MLGIIVLGAGIALGALGVLLFLSRNTYTEVVRDEHGRIVQVLEFSNVNLFGRGMLNVSDIGKPVREASEP